MKLADFWQSKVNEVDEFLLYWKLPRIDILIISFNSRLKSKRLDIFFWNFENGTFEKSWKTLKKGPLGYFVKYRFSNFSLWLIWHVEFDCYHPNLIEFDIFDEKIQKIKNSCWFCTDFGQNPPVTCARVRYWSAS